MHVLLLVVMLAVCGMTARGESSLDDKFQAFVKAVQETPADTVSPGVNATAPALLIKSLEQSYALSLDMNVARLVQSVMATRSSPAVQTSGADLVTALKLRAFERTKAVDEKVRGLLGKIPDVIQAAREPADLDAVLAEFKGLRGSVEAYYPEGKIPTMHLALEGAYLYLTQWQDYLAALKNGDGPQAQRKLQWLLDDRSITKLQFVPRSQILALRDQAASVVPNAKKTPGGDFIPEKSVDVLLRMKTVEDVTREMPNLDRSDPTIGNIRTWAPLHRLDEVRRNLEAGLPVTLEIGQLLNGEIREDDISRIIAMELMVILPRYLGTEKTDPPQPGETVKGYLDRISATANGQGNLALLQRTMAVHLGMINWPGNSPFGGSQQFLAGLSLEAAGQFAPAVVSYERALSSPDKFLSGLIVAERLTAIRKAHPEEFEAGYAAYLSSLAKPDSWSVGNSGKPFEILAIPKSISIDSPAKPSNSNTSAH